jgi:hypothetical protein
LSELRHQVVINAAETIALTGTDSL